MGARVYHSRRSPPWTSRSGTSWANSCAPSSSLLSLRLLRCLWLSGAPFEPFAFPQTDETDGVVVQRDEPVWALLGGKTKERIPCYCTTARPDLAQGLGFVGAKYPLAYVSTRFSRATQTKSPKQPQSRRPPPPPPPQLILWFSWPWCRLFLGPGFRLGARWNRLGETVKTRKKREKTGKKWARYGLKNVNQGS
eukprot:COSAG04_NODE_741_length_10670_cov_20.643837_9_plen_194_part_00